ncbi:TadE/TadG family type IV pilus assembly protein [Emcibacter sp.]|uniref:TadE/TadG family type IV pilus assembly protein n=1 Tax=Emcibacter sp. TaxID=1979954 RepID=UPI002AA6CFD0|nr:TadE/TadG family type IV pilus assembly protein [Emcibacter sp.]
MIKEYKNKKSGRLRGLLGRTGRDEKGAALIEAAFVLPVMTLLTLGTLEVGAVMLSTTLLEGAIADASRQGITGYTVDGMTREEYITSVLKDRTYGFITLDNLVITNKVYDTFTDIATAEPYTDLDEDGDYTNGIDSFTDLNCNNQWDADIGESGVGGPGAVVVYSAEYDANFMTGFFSHAIGDADGKIRLVTSTAVKNEPYGSPTADCDPQVKT